MKGFFIALVLFAVVVGILGFFMGWWSLSSSNSGTSTGVSLSVDKDKIREDAQKVQQEVGLGHQDSAKATEPAGESKQ